MIVVILAALLIGAVLLWALYAETPPAPEPVAPPPQAAWDGLPTPGQIRRRGFPLALGGYDRAAVDAHLAAVADAFTALHSAAVAADRGRTHRFAALGDEDLTPPDPIDPTPQAGTEATPQAGTEATPPAGDPALDSDGDG